MPVIHQKTTSNDYYIKTLFPQGSGGVFATFQVSIAGEELLKQYNLLDDNVEISQTTLFLMHALKFVFTKNIEQANFVDGIAQDYIKHDPSMDEIYLMKSLSRMLLLDKFKRELHGKGNRSNLEERMKSGNVVVLSTIKESTIKRDAVVIEAKKKQKVTFAYETCICPQCHATLGTGVFYYAHLIKRHILPTGTFSDPDRNAIKQWASNFISGSNRSYHCCFCKQNIKRENLLKHLRINHPIIFEMVST